MRHILKFKDFSLIFIFSTICFLPLQAKELRLTCEPMSGVQQMTKKGVTSMKPEKLTNYSNLKLDVKGDSLIFNNDVFKVINKSKNMVSGTFTTENSTSVVSLNMNSLAVTFSHHVVRKGEDYVLSVQGKCS